jgi:hypothetical protein
MKEFLKAAYGSMNGFPKASKVENFPRLLTIVCNGFRKPVLVATSSFHDAFVMALEAS